MSHGESVRLDVELLEGSLDAAMELIGLVVDQGVNVREVFVDTVGDPEKYAAKIRQRFPRLKVTVSKKADSLYPIVSASSICAKVIRDQLVQTWKFSEFAEEKNIGAYGSGYPGGEHCLASSFVDLRLLTFRSANETFSHRIVGRTFRFSEIRSFQLVDGVDDD